MHCEYSAVSCCSAVGERTVFLLIFEPYTTLVRTDSRARMGYEKLLNYPSLISSGTCDSTAQALPRQIC